MKKISTILLVLFIAIMFGNSVFANPIDWKNEQAYYPMPVLFIHGINSDATTWTSSINTLRQYFTDKYKKIELLDKNGQPYEYIPQLPAMRYLEVFDYGSNSMSGIASHFDALKEKVEAILETYYGPTWKSNPNAKIIIVGHSKGGLVARYYLKNCDPAVMTHIDRLVTIGTPHGGTWEATWGKPIAKGIIIHANGAPISLSALIVYVLNSNQTTKPIYSEMDSGAIDDLKVSSNFLKELNTGYQPPIPIVCITSDTHSICTPGDDLVPISSQEGVYKGTYPFFPKEIIAMNPGVTHTQETEVASPYILQAIDGVPSLSDEPQFEITNSTRNNGVRH